MLVAWLIELIARVLPALERQVEDYHRRGNLAIKVASRGPDAAHAAHEGKRQREENPVAGAHV